MTQPHPVIPRPARFARILLLLSVSGALAAAGCEKSDSAKPPGPESAQASAGDQKTAQATPASKAGDETGPAEKAPAKDSNQTLVADNATPADPAAPGGPGQAAEAAAAADAPPKVTLLSAGKGPRHQLRYTFHEGQHEKVAMTMTIGMEMSMSGGQSLPVQMPPIEMDLDLSVMKKLGAHEGRVKFVISKTDVKDTSGSAMAATLREQLAKAEGASGTVVVNDRGESRDMTLSLPAGMPQQMRQMMESSKQAVAQLSSPLPEEAVGRGARWKVDQVIRENGLTINQVAAFELKSVHGKRVVLKTTITQSAKNQAVAMPGIPAGVTATLLSHKGDGSGVIHADTNHLAPDASKVKIHTDSNLKVSGGGQNQSVAMKVNTNVDVKRR